MINAIKVEATDDFKIIVTLENNLVLRLDMNFIHDENGRVIDPLKDICEFKKVFVRDGIVTWPSGYDIDPYFLEDQGEPFSKIA